MITPITSDQLTVLLIDILKHINIYMCVCVCSKPCMEYASIYFVFNKYAKWTLRIYSISIFSQLYIVICDIMARYASLHEMQYLFNISKHIDGKKSGLGDVKNGKDLNKNKKIIYIFKRLSSSYQYQVLNCHFINQHTHYKFSCWSRGNNNKNS